MAWYFLSMILSLADRYAYTSRKCYLNFLLEYNMSRNSFHCIQYLPYLSLSKPIPLLCWLQVDISELSKLTSQSIILGKQHTSRSLGGWEHKSRYIWVTWLSHAAVDIKILLKCGHLNIYWNIFLIFFIETTLYTFRNQVTGIMNYMSMCQKINDKCLSCIVCSHFLR